MDGRLTDEAILEEARERFRLAKDADSENRHDALDDIKFTWNLNDYQWPIEVKRLREGRPCLTENRLPQFVRMVVNSQRQNRPSINVSPVDSKGDPSTAKVLEGMVRHIEQQSKADLAYDSAFENAVIGGIGYFRISTRYVPGEGENQEVAIQPIENIFSVYDDPHYSLPDGSDRQWCFVTEWIDREAYRQRFKSEPAPFEDAATGDTVADWTDGKRVMIAEYWCKKGDKVHQYLVSWDKVLERNEWSGTILPIIPVYGECRTVEGKKYRKSLVRDAKDLQKANNYWFSVETEIVALQPRAPFIGPVGAFETDAHKWATANTTNHAYLQYDPVDGAAPPMRQEPPAFPAAVRETRMAVIEGMKAVFGIYDASLGARSNETSGIALQERQEQGDLAVYHFLDNMTRAIRYAGNAIIELLPKIYDAPRVVRVVEPDGEAAMVAVNQLFIDPNMQQREINLAVGRYDVVVKAGPSFQTQRQEAAKAMTELVKAYPPLAQLAGDLLFKNMDFPDADKIAERLKPQSELPPQVQQQMQEMQQMLQQGQKYVADLESRLQKAEVEKQAKDLDRKKVEIQLQAKLAQDELMSGDTTGEEMLRLREENAKQAIELKMKDLKLLEAQLGLKAQELSTRESDINRSAVETEQKSAEVETVRGEQESKAAANEGVLAEMHAMLREMRELHEAPREIVRGADGRAAGVKIGGRVRNLMRGPDGRAMGLQ